MMCSGGINATINASFAETINASFAETINASFAETKFCRDYKC